VSETKIQKPKLSGEILASFSGKTIKQFMFLSAVCSSHVSWTSNFRIWDWKKVFQYYDDILILYLEPWN